MVPEEELAIGQFAQACLVFVAKIEPRMPPLPTAARNVCYPNRASKTSLLDQSPNAPQRRGLSFNQFVQKIEERHSPKNDNRHGWISLFFVIYLRNQIAGRYIKGHAGGEWQRIAHGCLRF